MKRFVFPASLLALSAAPGFADSLFNWTGFYAGGQGGVAWMKNGVSEAPVFSGITTSVKGPALGGTAGYNWQMSNWIAGFEGDFSWSNIKAHTLTGGDCDVGAYCDEKVRWFGTARVRLGYLAMPSLLLYGTGGFAWGSEDAKYRNAIGSEDEWKTGNGWAAGGGAEAAFAPNWTAKLEYMYVDLGRVEFSAVTFPAVFAAAPQIFKFNIIRIGVNYRFATP